MNFKRIIITLLFCSVFLNGCVVVENKRYGVLNKENIAELNLGDYPAISVSDNGKYLLAIKSNKNSTSILIYKHDGTGYTYKKSFPIIYSYEDNIQITWSNSNEKFAYNLPITPLLPSKKSDIFVYDIVKGKLRNLTEKITVFNNLESDIRCYSPVFSEDDSIIYFASGNMVKGEISSYNTFDDKITAIKPVDSFFMSITKLICKNDCLYYNLSHFYSETSIFCHQNGIETSLFECDTTIHLVDVSQDGTKIIYKEIAPYKYLMKYVYLNLETMEKTYIMPSLESNTIENLLVSEDFKHVLKIERNDEYAYVYFQNLQSPQSEPKKIYQTGSRNIMYEADFLDASSFKTKWLANGCIALNGNPPILIKPQ